MNDYVMNVGYLIRALLISLIISSCSSSSDQSSNEPVIPDDPEVTDTARFAGMWYGLLSSQSEQRNITELSGLVYEIELNPKGRGSYNGQGRIYELDSSRIYGTFNVNAVDTETQLIITQLDFTEVSDFDDVFNPDNLRCLRTLTLSTEGDQLEGIWDAPDCGSGELVLRQPPTVYDQLFASLPSCPCQLDESIIGSSAVDNLGFEGRWSEQQIDPNIPGLSIIDVLERFHPGASSGIRWTPSAPFIAGQQCTFDQNNRLITGGLAAGTPDSVAPGVPVTGIAFHRIFDVEQFEQTLIRPRLSCSEYLRRFPPNNANSCPSNIVSPLPTDPSELTCRELLDSGQVIIGPPFTPVPESFLSPRPASYTDPHLVTIDGLNYSFQTVGEFVLARSEINELEIQSRQERYGGSNSQVSVNTGFGFNVNGVRVSIVKSPSGDTALFINDVEQSQVGEIGLDLGGAVSVNASTYQLDWPDGSVAVVADRGNFLNLSLAFSAEHQGRISGLLGNFDGDVENDMKTSTGENLSTRPSANDLYGIFADGWRVDDDTSLLYYYDGQDTEFFTDRLFPGRAVSISDLDDATRATAEQICRAAGVTNEVLLEDCILDVGFSGDQSFADAILALQESVIDELTEVDVQGELDVPTLACDDLLQDNDLEGVYVGTMTNPDVNTIWNAELKLVHCGNKVIGVNINNFGDAFSNRRFEGTWNGNEMTISFGYPYTSDFTPVTGSNSACEGMTASLVRIGSMLSGTWTSSTSGCEQGGNISLTRASGNDSQSLYLNIQNIDVTEGENSTPSLNNTLSLNNIIDAATADSIETHTQLSHVWHTGPQLELIFDFRQEYFLEKVHFWNYHEEGFDVDSIELSFSDNASTVIGGMSLTPMLGSGNSTASEDIGVDSELSVRYVRAVITGTNNESDFLNIGFTVKAP